MTNLGATKWFGALGLSLALATSACASGGEPVAVPAAPPTAAGKAQERAPQHQKLADPVDPTAPATYVPVSRKGKKPQPTVKGNRGGFAKAKAVKYSDGVSIAIDRVGHGVEQGQGAGTFAGRPHTVLTVTVTNGSKAAVDLSQVVVTTMYGSPARLAPPVYEDAGTRDFTGTLQPGGAATATYAFAVPSEKEGNVVTIVDFDGEHVAAEFAGATS